MIIDANMSLGRWPFQRFVAETPAKLEASLKKKGISLALVSSIEAVLCRDPYICNKELLEKLEKYPALQPVMVVNPLLADWKERLREYGLLTKTNAVKIYPSYHNYSLSSGFMGPFMKELRILKRVLMVQVRIEDERSQFPSMRVPSVDISGVIRLALEHPENRIVCCCPSGSEAASLLKETENVFVDISYIDGLNCLPNLLRQFSSCRILFGSHAPFLYVESAKMKMMYEEISPADREKIHSGNILALLGTGDILHDGLTQG